jgi:hypothetical protein
MWWMTALGGCMAGEVASEGRDLGPVTLAVGPTGGTVANADGVQLTLPPGALREEVEITVWPYDGRFDIEPVDLALDLPATVCLPGSPSDVVGWPSVLDGLLPRRTSPGWGLGRCAEVGRLGAGIVLRPHATVGRPEIRAALAWLEPTTGGAWFGAEIQVYHPDGSGRLTQVKAVFPDGAQHGALDPIWSTLDSCTLETAWDAACTLDLFVAEPGPPWVEFVVYDEDDDAADVWTQAL